METHCFYCSQPLNNVVVCDVCDRVFCSELCLVRHKGLAHQARKGSVAELLERMLTEGKNALVGGVGCLVLIALLIGTCGLLGLFGSR
jgi:hypothetical protein